MEKLIKALRGSSLLSPQGQIQRRKNDPTVTSNKKRKKEYQSREMSIAESVNFVTKLYIPRNLIGCVWMQDKILEYPHELNLKQEQLLQCCHLSNWMTFKQ